MDAFTTLTSLAVPLRMANVDTDQLIPARFLKQPRSWGYDTALFHDLRRDEAGVLRDDFVLNAPHWQDARILVADRNFGCGSSREGAVYALFDAGFRCVIAPSFGDIFYSNSTKNGLLPVKLDRDEVSRIWRTAETDPNGLLTVDLERQHVRLGDGLTFGFEIDPFRKHCLLNGLDDIALTLEHEAAIAAHEVTLADAKPWLAK